jgi:putative two-component system response regulator
MAPVLPVRGRILVVDDDPALIGFLVRLLTADGHEVAVAASGAEALGEVRARAPDLVMLDLNMPGMSGFEVCQQLKSDPRTRLLPILVLTGRDPTDARLGAWDAGADEFLCKPVRSGELVARCRSLLRLKAALDDLDSAQAAVFAFSRAVEAKCPYTLGHTERVTGYAMRLADHAGVPVADREVVRRGAALHDIGKISTPDLILNKPSRLSPEEYAIVKRHPVQGVHIVEPLHSLRAALPLIRWHHERMDGRGYPDGLTREEIPLAARVLAVADVYDALASARPYRGELPHAECLAVMREDAAGGGLDAELVRCFADLFGAHDSEADGAGMTR